MRILAAALAGCSLLGAQMPAVSQRLEAAVPIASASAAAVPAGRADLSARLGELELQVFTYRPANWSGSRFLIILHGVLRNADEYRDHAVSMGDRFDMLVVAPKFDGERFPSRAYQRGGILRADGSAAPPGEWTYARIPELAAWVREAVGQPQLKFWIIGHSAGGQFALRMSAFQDTGAECIVAANPGSVLWPTKDLPFGYGFGGLPDSLADDARLQRYLAAPLVLYLGTADDRPDEHFDISAEAMQQGGGRHQRGLGLYWTARTVAAQRGWPFRWRLVEAPGAAHDHEQMFEHANCAVALFGDGASKPGASKSGSAPAEPKK
jgi:poly(3-hydroxybutyrate) depolymerase